MDEPSPKPPEKKTEQPAVQSFWPFIITLGAMFLGGYVLSQIESDSPGSAREIILWAIGIGSVPLVIWILKNVSLVEMGDGAKSLLKAVVVLIVVGLIFAPFVQCSGGGSSSTTDSFYRR